MVENRIGPIHGYIRESSVHEDKAKQKEDVSKHPQLLHFDTASFVTLTRNPLVPVMAIDGHIHRPYKPNYNSCKQNACD